MTIFKKSTEETAVFRLETGLTPHEKCRGEYPPEKKLSAHWLQVNHPKGMPVWHNVTRFDLEDESYEFYNAPSIEGAEPLQGDDLNSVYNEIRSHILA